MTPETAPFHNDVALGPPDVAAHWLKTTDGVRIRACVWGGGLDAPKGVILLLPGRTEYVEKYGLTAQSFLDQGFITVGVDWRGQGLSDRFLPDRAIGHVTDFKTYQHDVDAVANALGAMGIAANLPRFLLGHSMGGCIGLRSLTEGLSVRAAAFTAPMWGIAMGRSKRAAAWTISSAARRFGFDNTLAPLMSPVTYVLAQPFDDNMLTTDPEMFSYMQEQMRGHPDLALGGPSLAWLNEGLVECRRLAGHPTPDIPCITFLGTNERIVDTGAIKDRMARWPQGTLHVVDGAEHELLMEVAAIREDTIDKIVSLFAQTALQHA